MGMYLENMKTLIQKDTCTLMFIAALFQYLTHGNLSVHSRQLTQEEVVLYTHDGILPSLEYEGAIPVYSNVDELKEYA